MQADIFYFFLFLGVFQGFFMSVLLLFMKSENAGSNRILALLFLDLSTLLCCMIFAMSGFGNLDLLRLIFTPLYFLLGPCLYFYVKKYNDPNAGFTMKVAAHCIPSLLAIAYYHPKYFFSGWASFIDYNDITALFWDFFLVHFIVYILSAMIVIRKVIKKPGKHSLSTDPVYSWFVFLYRFFLVSFIIMTALTIDDRIRIYTGSASIALSDNIIAVFAVFIICAVSFKGFMHPAVFFGKPGIFSLRKNSVIMSPEKIKAIMNTLTSLIEKEKPYLDPDLTLPDLAEKTGFSRSDLSWAINTDREQNFYDYINEYRVETVKRLLSENIDLSMIEIAHRSGFTTKSTFNNVFKRNTGFSPTEYKNNLTAGGEKSGKL